MSMTTTNTPRITKVSIDLHRLEVLILNFSWFHSESWTTQSQFWTRLSMTPTFPITRIQRTRAQAPRNEQRRPNQSTQVSLNMASDQRKSQQSWCQFNLIILIVLRDSSSLSRKAGSSRTPMLTSLLDRSRAKTLSRTSSHSAPNHPTISHPLPLSSRPPYRPTSTVDFLARLATFKLATYRDKSRGTDAVAASRCGWKNDGQDRLVCDNCSAAWVVGSTAGMGRDAGKYVLWCVRRSPTDDQWHSFQTAKTLTERQRAAMVTTHKESCPWRKRQCDGENSVYTIRDFGSSCVVA